MTRSKRLGTPEKVSDIEISRVFEVYCNDCGMIDAPKDYATAVRSRREHWFSNHKATDRG